MLSFLQEILLDGFFVERNLFSKIVNWMLDTRFYFLASQYIKCFTDTIFFLLCSQTRLYRIVIEALAAPPSVLNSLIAIPREHPIFWDNNCSMAFSRISFRAYSPQRNKKLQFYSLLFDQSTGQLCCNLLPDFMKKVYQKNSSLPCLIAVIKKL